MLGLARAFNFEHIHFLLYYEFMPIQVLLSFVSFVIISSITPGPANLTSLATALQFGKKPALKQWTGLYTGYCFDTLISVLIVYFLGAAFSKYVSYLAIVGVAYMIYLAVRMLRQTYSTDQKNVSPPGFWRGILVQLTNVKVILTCITSLSSYVLPYYQDFGHILLLALILPAIGPMCPLIWLFTGVILQRFFVKYQKIVNIVMAVALILCALSLLTVYFV